MYYGPDGNLYYTPTRLASSLCGGGGGGGGLLSGGSSSGSGASAVMADAASTDGGFIIVESNYRVSACVRACVGLMRTHSHTWACSCRLLQQRVDAVRVHAGMHACAHVRALRWI